MDETNIITMLFYTQRDVYNIIKSTQKMQETNNVTIDLEHKLLDALENQPKIKDIYLELDKATGDYFSAIEDNIYYHAFKTGFKLAIELGLCKL